MAFQVRWARDTGDEGVWLFGAEDEAKEAALIGRFVPWLKGKDRAAGLQQAGSATS